MNVFIIDDNEDDREEISEVLNKIGVSATSVEFSSGDEFRKAFLRRRNVQVPTMIFLDIRMEECDTGFTLLTSIRRSQRLRSIPVIMVSTSDEDADVRRAFSLGANLYITKSEEPLHFGKKVGRVLSAILDNSVILEDGT